MFTIKEVPLDLYIKKEYIWAIELWGWLQSEVLLTVDLASSSGISNDKKSTMLPIFWVEHERFFKSFWTMAKVHALIGLATKVINEGKYAVIGI